jgi:glycosyltransferase involved in cell wall biosynthesis
MKNRARSPDLKILASHPIQYHVPFIREMVARGLDVEVAYYHQGTAGRMGHDAEFGLDFEWDLDLLGGYRHSILQSGRATYTWSEQTRIAQRLVPWMLRDRSPVLLMGWFAEITWLVWLLGVVRRVPMLVLSETTPLSFRASYKPRWRVRLLSWLLRRSAACLYIGTRNRTFLSEMGVDQERLFHCPYSVDNSFFYEQTARLLPQREGYCLQYGLDPSLPAFLFSGKLIPKKRPLNLLNAYLDAGLDDRAQLIFVGEGSERHALARRIGECGARHVHLLGFFNYRAMPLAYVLGEVLCLPSGPTETWGLVVNESLACRRPAIVSAAAGCAPDLVGPGNGWIVPVDNHAALVQALHTAFESRAEWPVMGLAGKAKVAGHTFSKMVDGVEAALALIHK